MRLHDLTHRIQEIGEDDAEVVEEPDFCEQLLTCSLCNMLDTNESVMRGQQIQGPHSRSARGPLTHEINDDSQYPARSARGPITHGINDSHKVEHAADQWVPKDLDDPPAEISRDLDERPAFTVESQKKPGEMLRLVSPHSHEACQGEYRLVTDTVVNGHPLYELKDRGRWLYTGLDGRWYIGGRIAKAKDFACSSGYIFHYVPHDGKLPRELEGHWSWGDSCTWHEDPAITVVDTACLA